MKDSIVVFTAYLDKFGALSDEQFGQLFRALLMYQKGVEPQISDSMVELAFGVARYDVDACNKKYDDICEQNRRNIRERWKRANEDSGVYERIRPNTNEYETVRNDTDYTDTDTDTDTDIDTEKKKGSAKALLKEEVRRIIDAWNSLPSIIPTVKNLDPQSKRYKMLNARIETYGVEGVLSAIENVRTSGFCQGQGNRGWVIDFEWFVKPNNFPKVYEGTYNNRTMAQNKNAQQLDSFYSDVDDWVKGRIS